MPPLVTTCESHGLVPALNGAATEESSMNIVGVPCAFLRLLRASFLGAVDAAIGAALGGRELRERADALGVSSGALGEAIRLDEVAIRTKERADAWLREQKYSKAAAQQAHADTPAVDVTAATGSDL
jgi:hypothetical protein